jgi:hypothetical protein
MHKFLSYHLILHSTHMFIAIYLICKDRRFDNTPLWYNYRETDPDCWLGKYSLTSPLQSNFIAFIKF